MADSESDKEWWEADFGAEVVGTFIGTDTYVLDQLQRYVEKVRGQARRLMSYPSL